MASAVSRSPPFQSTAPSFKYRYDAASSMTSRHRMFIVIALFLFLVPAVQAGGGPLIHAPSPDPCWIGPCEPAIGVTVDSWLFTDVECSGEYSYGGLVAPRTKRMLWGLYDRPETVQYREPFSRGSYAFTCDITVSGFISGEGGSARAVRLKHPPSGTSGSGVAHAFPQWSDPSQETVAACTYSGIPYVDPSCRTPVHHYFPAAIVATGSFDPRSWFPEGRRLPLVEEVCFNSGAAVVNEHVGSLRVVTSLDPILSQALRGCTGATIEYNGPLLDL